MERAKLQSYETAVEGIRVLPGQWRPHYPFEHIAWVSPPWSSQEYVWLDFPEAIFSDAGLLYLSHENPQFPVLIPDLPSIPWQQMGEGSIGFERHLPNGIEFGGIVGNQDGSVVTLTIFIRNGSSGPLRDIKLQTCTFLRGTKEFADYTMANKFLHVANRGWMRFEEARDSGITDGRYHLGWRHGPKAADRQTLAEDNEWGLLATARLSTSDRKTLHS